MRPAGSFVRFGESFRVVPQRVRSDGSSNLVSEYCSREEQDRQFSAKLIENLASRWAIVAATDLRDDALYVHVNGPKRQSYDAFAPLRPLIEQAEVGFTTVAASSGELTGEQKGLEQLDQADSGLRKKLDELALVSNDTPELPVQFELRNGKRRLLNADDVARALKLMA